MVTYMTKTPEELAVEHANNSGELEDTYVWRADRDGFLAGYKAGQEHPFQFEAKMWVDPIGPQYRWISVKDRLPEQDVAVLIYGQVLNNPPEVIGVRRRYNGDQEWKHTWESEDGFIYREDDVTHWMPLPAAPKEEV